MPPGAPRALRCEYQVDPIGLGTRQPRFFWKLDDERPGARQTRLPLAGRLRSGAARAG